MRLPLAVFAAVALLAALPALGQQAGPNVRNVRINAPQEGQYGRMGMAVAASADGQRIVAAWDDVQGTCGPPFNRPCPPPEPRGLTGVGVSTDGGRTWTAISPDLTGGPSRDAYPFGTITTVAAGYDGRTVYVGTDDGRVWVTRDLGQTWTLLLSGRPWVTRITVSPADAGTAWVTISGYRSGSPLPHVLRTTDYGASWADLSGNLPQAPVNDIVLGDGSTLYVATDQSVFVSAAGDGQWQRLGTGLPMVPVHDIEYDGGHHRLVAATFGRSMYELAT